MTDFYKMRCKDVDQKNYYEYYGLKREYLGVWVWHFFGCFLWDFVIIMDDIDDGYYDIIIYGFGTWP